MSVAVTHAQRRGGLSVEGGPASEKASMSELVACWLAYMTEGMRPEAKAKATRPCFSGSASSSIAPHAATPRELAAEFGREVKRSAAVHNQIPFF